MKETLVKYKKPLIIAGVLLILAIIYFSSGSSSESKTLAKCLKDKGAKFYGASWCPHCQSQKKMFGDASSLLPYIECTENEKQCKDANVTGYPTWIFADGKRQSGEVSLDQLKQLSGC